MIWNLMLSPCIISWKGLYTLPELQSFKWRMSVFCLVFFSKEEESYRKACKLPFQALRPNSDLSPFWSSWLFCLLKMGEMDFKTILVWFTKQTYNLLSIFYSMFWFVMWEWVIFSRTKRQYKNKLLKKSKRVISKESYAMCMLSDVWLFAAPWTVACQVPESIEFSSQESWSGLPFHTPGNLPDPGIKPTSLALASRFITTKPPWKHISKKYLTKNIIFFLIAIINQCTRHFSCLWDFWILVYTIPLQLYSSQHQCPYTQIAQHSGL